MRLIKKGDNVFCNFRDLDAEVFEKCPDFAVLAAVKIMNPTDDTCDEFSDLRLLSVDE